MKKILVVMAIVAVFAGCARPIQFTNQRMQPYDSNTRYVIEEVSDGFIVSIAYSRYQFIPESDVVAKACTSQLTSIAWEHADKANRKIQPINEQRIKISMGRNGFVGITSCSAQVKVEWE